MPSPITINVQDNSSSGAFPLTLGDNEDTPYPNVVSYHKTSKGSVSEVLGLGQFGSVGQQIDYVSTQWNTGTVREYVRIFGEVRGHQYAEALKALFKYNVNTIAFPGGTIGRFGTGPGTQGDMGNVGQSVGSKIIIILPFIPGVSLNAMVLQDEVEAVPGTLDRYRYDITFMVAGDQSIIGSG